MKDFSKLLEPFRIGKVKTRNRIIKTASGTSLWSPGERRVTEKGKAFYEALAKGGAGLIMVESPIVEYPFDEPGDVRMRIDDDRYIAEVSEIADVIHRHGCPAFVQIYHRGPWTQPYAPNRPHIASSPVVPEYSEFDLHATTPPRELSVKEINELTELFARIAGRLQRAGFDGMEINAGCDHLFASFLSRFWNKRTDSHGSATMENRSRFLVETVTAIKKTCGADFAMSVLINAVEGGMGDEGMTYPESRALAKILENAGVDALHVRSHWLGHHVGSYNHENLFYPEPCVPLRDFPQGLDWSHRGKEVNVPAAEIIKKEVSIPIITVSGIVPERGEAILRQGKADFIGMCRPLFADPALPKKLAEGRPADVAPCTRCGTCQKMNGLPKECRVNGALGTERYEVTKAERQKRVVVIGGGPAGMEAARVAAMRGHRVTLFDKSTKLGGTLPVAALVKGLEIENIPDLVNYLARQIAKLGVEVKKQREFDVAWIDREAPNVAVIATGGIPTTPRLKGIEGKNVVKSADLHGQLKFFLRFFSPGTLRRLTKFWMPVGRSVVILGGQVAACQLAEFLVKRGRKVTIIEEGDVLGEGLILERKNRLFSWFRKKGVATMTGVHFDEVTPSGMVVTTKEGKRLVIEADTIIPALPMQPNNGLAEEIKKKVPEVCLIGDCKEPKLIPDAIADGWRVGNTI
jgi:2,4-dienoyl-CoA reductase (NADPH2)